MAPTIVPIAERLLKPSSIAALAASILLLVLIAAGSGLVALRTQRATVASQALQRDRDAATNALLSLERAETGQRGYLLTGQDEYLATYNVAVRNAPQRLADLAASQDVDVRITRLHDLAQTKLAELARTVELAKSGNRDGALALVRTNEGLNTMREYRTLSTALLQAQSSRLAALVERVSRDTRLVVWLDGLGVAAVLALASLLTFGTRRVVGVLRGARQSLALANGELSRSNERLERAVKRRTAELTHANDEIQRFAYIVSHDLRSPLVNVMGFTSELEVVQSTLHAHLADAPVPEPVRQAVSEDMPESIRFIRTSTAKMDRLIQAILQLSREGRRRLAPEPVDMTALLRAVADTMAHPAQAAGATIEVAEAPPLVSDRLSLEQVFSNLMENALKYAKPGRPVRVELRGRRDGSRVRYTVADNGRGIAERDLERIFDLFRRAGDQSVPGEGIGLAHVRALVRRLGGTISCTSELGAGAVFTVELPAEAAQQMDLAA